VDNRIWIAAGAALGFAALSPAPAEARQAVDCRTQADGDHIIRIENVAARPGTELAVSAERMLGPLGASAVEPRCVRTWRVTPARHARLSRDRTRLIIAPDAPVGTVIAIEARVGATVMRGEVTVTGADTASVLGSWERSCGATAGDGTIGQLILLPDRYFAFDVLGRQWSGDYRFDPATGAIAFGPLVLPSPEQSRMEGVAMIDRDGRLRLDDVFFADPYGRPAGADCPMVFARRP
jgi:hypothetical protein